VITHVPAGLGVLEAVFVALLGGQASQAELIAALLAYRALYYLVPLGVAALVLFRLEARASSRASSRAVAGAGRRSRRRPIEGSSYTR